MCSCYPPITVSSVTGKILESVILPELISELDYSQLGFRKHLYGAVTHCLLKHILGKAETSGTLAERNSPKKIRH